MRNSETLRNCKIIIIGSLIYDIVIIAILAIFVIIYKLDSILFLGVILGSIWNIICIMHIGYVLERSFDSQDDNYAKRFTTIQSIMRKIIFMVLVIMVVKFFGPYTGIAMIVAVLGIKFGTFLYPILDKKIK